MSHQNADEKETIKSETLLFSDRELATALRAMALATQDPSPIFELNVDCWEEIFDWLSVDDLHSFGQTCKFFHRIAGKYFEWKYRRTLVHVHNSEMEFFWKDLPGFNEFAQKLSISYTEQLLYASENCKSPKELKFVGIRSSDLNNDHLVNLNRLEKMLASVEVVTFEYSCITDEFMESILKLCSTNLKRLSIERTMKCNWMHHKYPKLQHLKLYGVNSAQELVRFLDANPNVRSFTTNAENILKYRKELMTSTIELDDLTVVGETTMHDISNTLIDLYERGFYKRLHFTIFTRKYLADLPGLTTLHPGINDYIDLPHLPTVTRMSFRPLWHGLGSWLNTDEVTNALPNLEFFLMHSEANLEFIMPFIQKSKKLKEIKMKYNDYYGDMDPSLMNREREKLNGAHKPMIYVEEEDYLRIKWKYMKSDFGLVQFKRRESYDGILDHCFDAYDE